MTAEAPASYIDALQSSSLLYRGFSFLFGDIGNAFPFIKLLYHPDYQHRLPLSSSLAQLDWSESDHIYSLSNGDPERQAWFKVKRAKELLKESIEMLSHSQEQFSGPFWRTGFVRHVLLDRRQCRDDEIPKTRFSKDIERHMSSIFVSPIQVQDGRVFGTVSSMIIMVDSSNRLATCIEYDWRQYQSLVKEEAAANLDDHDDSILERIETVMTIHLNS